MSQIDGEPVSFPPGLVGAEVSLLPVTPDDHRFLHWVATAGDNGIRWRYRMQLPPFEMFVQQLHHDVLAQFVIWERASGTRVGHVVSYALDLRNQTTCVGCVLAPEALGRGVGREALDLFVSYLASTWPFRKVYAEVPDFTFREFLDHPFGIRQDGLWVHEATLSDHLFCGGRLWDLHIVSTTLEPVGGGHD